MVPFWVRNNTAPSIWGTPKKGPLILTTTHISLHFILFGVFWLVLSYFFGLPDPDASEPNKTLIPEAAFGI